ncbi:MAG: heat-inducible transcription repressor HrcA, partial [candidate division Zixibacteria bacterium]|nr:heat-inducible transcription repressor HrcA [candidate division Zixibacteria bacterium]
GRIPTDKGYRVYVDSLLKPAQLTQVEKRKIKRSLESENLALGPILEQTSRVLAYISNQLGVIVAPRFESGILTRITMVPVAQSRVLVVVAVKSGLVRSIVMEVETDLKPELVEQTASLLTERLGGLSLGELRENIRERLSGISYGDPKLLELFVDSCDDIFSEHLNENIHAEGTANLVRHPEFRNVDDISKIIGIVEDRTFLANIFDYNDNEKPSIAIGTEIKQGQAGAVSVVSSTYNAGTSKGVLGVMGPTRMPYSKIVSVVEYTARLLSKMLSN